MKSEEMHGGFERVEGDVDVFGDRDDMDEKEFEAELLDAEEAGDAERACAGETQAEVIDAQDAEEKQIEPVLVLGDDDPRDSGLHEQILSEEPAWRGRILDVHTAEVRLPNGRVTGRDLIRHPGASAVVALTESGKIVLVRQYRTALDRVTVEIPAGKLDPGEDPLECAKRELLEETGFKAARVNHLTTIATTPGFCDEVIHLYMATGLTFAGANPDDDEFVNVDLVPLSELIDAVLDGKIEDAKTVIGALACDAISHRL